MNYKFLSTCSREINSLFRGVLFNPSKSRTCTYLQSRVKVRQTSEKTSFLKICSKLAGIGLIGASASYYLGHKFVPDFKWNTLIVHAVEEDRPRVHPHNFLVEVIDKAQPAVVNIEVNIRHPFTNQIIKSHGSGFVVREDGLILTNAHVISRQTHVHVKFQNGRVVEGQVQAVDPVTDLATIKVNEKNLPTLKLGKSSALKPGEFVIAMGSPLTLNNTVTHGIISSVNRGSDELGMHNRDMEYIQTDAIITKGNSGGPLVNMYGEAIGINTLNMMSGFSFAIPSDRAADFLNKAEKLEKRASSKGWFGMRDKASKHGRYVGITMFTLSPDFLLDLQARVPNFPQSITRGVLIQTVAQGSPAHRAGLRPADIIVKVNDKEVRSSEDVYKQVEVNDTLFFEVVRKNERFVLTVVPDLVD